MINPKNIIGSGGGKGVGGGTARTPVESADTLRSNALVSILNLISEGEIVGLGDEPLKNVYFDDVPVMNTDGEVNFMGVELQERVGLTDQEPIDLFPTAMNEIRFQRPLLHGSPVTIQISDLEVDAVRIKVQTNALSFLDQTTGDLKGSSVSLSFTARAQDSDGNITLTRQLGFGGRDTIAGKTTSAYQRDYDIALASFITAAGEGGRVFIDIERLTEDSDMATLNNDISVISYTELQHERFIYPNSALVAMKFNAELFGGQLPTATFQVKGIKMQVPTGYNPETREYPAIWDGTFHFAYSNNPAWVLYDILTNNRYGLGQFINESQINKWDFYTIARYCDEMVPSGYLGLQPRFEFNGVLTNAVEAYRVITTIASVFRSKLFWAGGKIGLTQDSPKDAVKIVGPENVIGGEFRYEGASNSSRHTAVLVTYLDPDDNYRPAVELVEDNALIQRYGLRTIEITAFGTTSRGQAWRLGKALLETEKNESEVVQYTAGLDHADVLPGDIIWINAPTRSNEDLTDRIRSIDRTATQTTITSFGDSTPQINDSVRFQNLDASLTDGFVITAIDGNTITLDGVAPSHIDTPAFYLIDRMSLRPSRWRVLSSVFSRDQTTFEIVANKYEPDKYPVIDSDEDHIFDTRSESTFTTGALQPPTNLTKFETTYKKNGRAVSKLTLSWFAPDDPRVSVYRITGTGPDDNELAPVFIAATSIDIDDIQPGPWRFDIVSLSSNNGLVAGSSTATIEVVVEGKIAPPADVQNFRANNKINSVELTWDKVEDVDLDFYSIRRSDNPTSWSLAETVQDSIKATSLEIEIDTADPIYYYIKSIDTSGIESLGTASVRTQASAPADVNDFRVSRQGNSIRATWSNNYTSGVSVEIREGPYWEAGTVIGRGIGSELLAPFTTAGRRNVSFLARAVSPLGVLSVATARFVLVILPTAANFKVFDVSLRDEGFTAARVNWERIDDPDERGVFILANTGDNFSTPYSYTARLGDIMPGLPSFAGTLLIEPDYTAVSAVAQTIGNSPATATLGSEGSRTLGQIDNPPQIATTFTIDGVDVSSGATVNITPNSVISIISTGSGFTISEFADRIRLVDTRIAGEAPRVNEILSARITRLNQRVIFTGEYQAPPSVSVILQGDPTGLSIATIISSDAVQVSITNAAGNAVSANVSIVVNGY